VSRRGTHLGGGQVNRATLLIRARVARGWTEHEPDDALGVAEQRVRRSESIEAPLCGPGSHLRCGGGGGIAVTERAVLGNPEAA
jgi:hypothetical protein